MGAAPGLEQTARVDAASAGAAGRRPPRDVLDPRPWLAATLVVLVLLALTGWWQVAHYRPQVPVARTEQGPSWQELLELQTGGPSLTWDQIDALQPVQVGASHGDGWVSDAHRGFAVVFLAVGLGLVIAVIRWMWREHVDDLVALAALGVGLGASGLAFSSSHRLLWDQLALWAVTVGTNIRGVWVAAFGDQIRFVLVDGREITQDDYAAQLLGHAVAVPVLLVGAAGLLALRLRRR